VKIIATAIMLALVIPASAATDDDIATILATIMAAERFGCIPKGTGERLVDHYQYETGFELADFVPNGRSADLVQLHLRRTLEFDRGMGRQKTCEAMLGVLEKL
jgi:hypothetical protein